LYQTSQGVKGPLVTVLALAAALATAAAAGSAATNKRYTDPRGDAGPDADIVLVQTKHEGDWVRIEIQFARHPPFDQGVILSLLLDTASGAGRAADGADAVFTWNTAKDRFRATRWQDGRAQGAGSRGTGYGTDSGPHGSTIYLFLVQKSVWNVDHPKFAVLAQELKAGKVVGSDRAPAAGYLPS
jgi:hypothetical protein